MHFDSNSSPKYAILLICLAISCSAQDKNDRLIAADDEKPAPIIRDTPEIVGRRVAPKAVRPATETHEQIHDEPTVELKQLENRERITIPDHPASHQILPNRTVTSTKYGDVEGFVHLIGVAPGFGKVTADIFLGIPYAKPPVGALRFEKPEAPTNFPGGHLDALNFPAACASFAPLVGEPRFSEDCLYLNVFAPPKHVQVPEGFPVVVWIHGGGFSSGASQIYGYRELSANFVSRGIIVVSIQYRLGMFGFMSSGDKNLPGNLGLWDQRAALLWVQENIRQFGGDPKRVTLWGENSGAASVGALSLSKSTRDLFAQSIQMSGSVFSGWAVSDSVVDTSRTIAKFLDCPIKITKKMKSCLKEKSAEEIASAGAKLSWLRDDINFVRMQPRIDGDFFDADLDALLDEAPKKPTIQGLNSQESMVLTMPFPGAPKRSALIVKPEELNNFGRDNLVQFINKTVIPDGLYGDRTPEVRESVIGFYADRNVSLQADSRFYLTRYTQILSDLQFAVPILTEVSKKSQEDWPVYLYLLNYMNPRIQLPVLGTFQTYEFPYLFGFSIVGKFEFDENDRKLQQVMVLSLANFIGTGNPSTNFSIWPPVTAEHPFGFFDIRPQPVLRDNLMLNRLTFWRELAKIYNFDLVQRKPLKPKLDF